MRPGGSMASWDDPHRFQFHHRTLRGLLRTIPKRGFASGYREVDSSLGFLPFRVEGFPDFSLQLRVGDILRQTENVDEDISQTRFLWSYLRATAIVRRIFRIRQVHQASPQFLNIESSVAHVLIPTIPPFYL